jgi:hypothetical protein
MNEVTMSILTKMKFKLVIIDNVICGLSKWTWLVCGLKTFDFIVM